MRRFSLAAFAAGCGPAQRPPPPHIPPAIPETIARFAANPLITRAMVGMGGPDENGDGASIAFPSIVKVPAWVAVPLGVYYLYFSHHHGSYIRMAYADDLAGPWTIYNPATVYGTGGVMTMVELDAAVGGPPTPYPGGHIASPEVWAEDGPMLFYMWFHASQQTWGHKSGFASSPDGLNWTIQGAGGLGNGVISNGIYMRHMLYSGQYFAICRSAAMVRMGALPNGPQQQVHDQSPFSDSIFPDPPNDPPRHFSSPDLIGSTAWMYHSTIGDAPEHIYGSRIELTPPSPGFNNWEIIAPYDLMFSEEDYEGVNEPITPSADGGSYSLVHQLRDPQIYREAGTRYLLGAAGGENSIEIATISEPAIGP